MRIRINAQTQRFQTLPQLVAADDGAGQYQDCRNKTENGQRKEHDFSYVCLCILYRTVSASPGRGSITMCFLSVYLSSGAEGFITWKFLPVYPTFEHYARVLFYTPQFFVVFSVFQETQHHCREDAVGGQGQSNPPKYGPFSVGDRITTETLLFEIDMSDLEEQIREQEMTIKKLSLTGSF